MTGVRYGLEVSSLYSSMTDWLMVNHLKCSSQLKAPQWREKDLV